MLDLILAQTASDAMSHSLTVGFLAALGVIGLVLKDLFVLFRPKVPVKAVDERDEREWTRQEQFRRDIYQFTQAMVQLHTVDPKTGKVLAFCGMIEHGERMVHLLEAQNGQMDRLSDSILLQSKEISKLMQCIQARPCIVGTDVLDKLLEMRSTKHGHATGVSDD